MVALQGWPLSHAPGPVGPPVPPQPPPEISLGAYPPPQLQQFASLTAERWRCPFLLGPAGSPGDGTVPRITITVNKSY